MSIKAGLRALALGVAMVCGGSEAQAATYTVATSFEPIAFKIVGDVSGPITLDFHLHLDAPPSWPHISLMQGIQSTADIRILDHLATPLIASSSTFLPTSAYHPDSNIPYQLDAYGSVTLNSAAQFVWVRSLALGPPNKIMSTFGVLTMSLPDGLMPSFATPLPAALPLFASVLGVGGWLGYRRKRAQRDAIAAAA